MTPPLREAHAHIHLHGRALAMPNLADCRDVGECLDRLAAEAASLPAGQWLLAAGARVESWAERRWPCRDELDRAAGGRPCAILSFDHHAVMAGSAALGAAGLCDSSPPPGDGVLVRDADGSLTGLLLEGPAHRLWNAAPEPTPAQRREQLRAALADFARLGFAEVHDLHSPAWLGPALARLDDAGELSMHVVLFPNVEEVEAVAASAPSWTRERIRLGGAKLFADGTLNSRTAWMLHPYRDGLPEHPCGVPMAGEERLRSAVRRVDRLGLPLATHAIGDAAVRAVLSAIEAERPRTPGFRIEHCEIIDEADVPGFARLGVVASVQPCHLLYDGEALRRYLPHRLGRVLPLRDLIDAGCRPGELLWFGSDAPVVRPDPGDSIEAATLRRRSAAPDSDAIAPEQAITHAEALACFAIPKVAP